MLSLIQGKIDAFHQRLHVVAIQWIHTDTNTCGEVNITVINAVGLRHGLDHFDPQLSSDISVTQFWQRDHEFIAP